MERAIKLAFLAARNDVVVLNRNGGQAQRLFDRHVPQSSMNSVLFACTYFTSKSISLVPNCS